jgi:long-subunit fatty acid transport protein
MLKFNQFTLLVLITISSVNIAFGGGIVTNTNQSASYIRMAVRDASNEIDAVYFNPAALTDLPDGLSLSLNNQTISQNRNVSNDYFFLNTKEFNGKVSVPLFPSIYACYKFSDFAFSLGFNPIGGGGSAEYEKGLPSFQLGIADLVPSLGGKDNVSYTTDIYFKGNSVYWGIQGGVTYKICDVISIFGGVRYNIAQNTYTGHLKNTLLNVKSMNFNGKPDSLFSNLATNYRLAKEKFAAAGLTDSVAKYTALEAQMNMKSSILSNLLGNQEADVEQTGNGITPIIGLNFKLLDNKLNIGIKYELNTPLVLKNKTNKDLKVGYTIVNNAPQYITQFPDGMEKNADIPALLSVGVSYEISKELKAAVGFHYFFDKSANWDGLQDSLESNTYEIGIGLEYSLSDKFLLSTGFMQRSTNAGSAYQSDLSYALGGPSFAFGGRYKLMENLDLNLGVLYTSYTDATKSTERPSGQANYTFAKDNLAIAIGFDWHILGK